MPNIMGDVGMRATESETPNDDICGPMHGWWIRFGVRSNVADIERCWEEIGKGKDRRGG